MLKWLEFSKKKKTFWNADEGAQARMLSLDAGMPWQISQSQPGQPNSVWLHLTHVLYSTDSTCKQSMAGTTAPVELRCAFSTAQDSTRQTQHISRTPNGVRPTGAAVTAVRSHHMHAAAYIYSSWGCPCILDLQHCNTGDRNHRLQPACYAKCEDTSVPMILFSLPTCRCRGRTRHQGTTKKKTAPATSPKSRAYQALAQPARTAAHA